MKTLLCALMLCATVARADVPPPNASGCASKTGGAACTDDANAAGACAKNTCSKLDYSDGSPPSSVSYECLLCVAGASPAVDAGTGATPVKTGCTAVPGGLLAAAAVFFALRKRR